MLLRLFLLLVLFVVCLRCASHVVCRNLAMERPAAVLSTLRAVASSPTYLSTGDACFWSHVFATIRASTMYLNPLKVKGSGGQHPELLFPRAPLTELEECLKEMPPLPSLGTTFRHR